MSVKNVFIEAERKRTYQLCPICQSEKIKMVLSATDQTVSREKFQVWECQNCSARFTQEVPVESEIGRYYQSEEYISHTDTNKGIINRLYQVVRNYTLNQKVDLVKKLSGKDQGNILDLGCGTGDFLGAMEKYGWKTLGLEPDEGARAIAMEKNNVHTKETQELFQLEPNSFDMVSMWHVLEHVHELHSYLEQIRSILKNDGNLIIAVPNYQSLDAQHYQDKWAAYDVPRHLYHFSPLSMEKLLEKNGFRMKKMKHMPFDSFYVSLLSEKYKGGKVNLFSGFWQGFRSFLNANGHAEKCSSVLYIAEKS